jgi:DNA-binding FadR family transcriptional regulator
MGLADLLFLRKTDKNIAELEKIALSETHDGEERFRVKNEIAFHGKLYEITGNNTLKRFQVMLLPVFGYVTTLEKREEYKTGKVNHRDLVNILKTGTKEDFKAGMYEHLKPHFDSLSNK